MTQRSPVYHALFEFKESLFALILFRVNPDDPASEWDAVMGTVRTPRSYDESVEDRNELWRHLKIFPPWPTLRAAQDAVEEWFSKPIELTGRKRWGPMDIVWDGLWRPGDVETLEDPEE